MTIQPSRGPVVEILGQHLGEERRLALGILRDREPLEEPASRAVEHRQPLRRGARAVTATSAADRRARNHPTDAALAPEPTAPSASSSRIPGLPRASGRAHPTGRGAIQPWALDDPAPADPRLPWLACHRWVSSLLQAPRRERSAPAAGVGGPRALPSAAPWGMEPDEREGRTGLRP